MIRTIFFDFGNVVGFFDHQRAIARLSQYTDLRPTELALILYGSPLEADYESGLINTTQYIASARADARLQCTDEEFIAAYTDIFWANPEIPHLLPKLQEHYRLGLASNTNDAHCARFREQFKEVLAYFDFLVVSYEAKSRKPHEAFFAYCQNLAQCRPDECLFLDDMPSNIAAAKAFGWEGIVYWEGTDLVAELCAHGIQGLDDISPPNR